MKKNIVWVRIFLLYFGLFCSQSYSKSLDYKAYSYSVLSSNSLKCEVYAFIPEATWQLPVVLYQAGTGIYSNAEFEKLDPSLRYLFNEKLAAIVVVDKPGIHQSNSSPKGFKVVHDVFNVHTQDDLIDCAERAVVEIHRHIPKEKVSEDVYLRGHSEGAQVLTRLFEKWLIEKNPQVENVKLITLSGLPMKSWRLIIEKQLSEDSWINFLQAYKQKNSERILEMLGGVSYAYIENIFSTPSLEKTLEKLWSLDHLNTPFQVYQGLNDELTPVEAVLAFEKKNKLFKTNNVDESKKGLSFHARYYQTGHSLSMDALNDMVVMYKIYMGLRKSR